MRKGFKRTAAAVAAVGLWSCSLSTAFAYDKTYTSYISGHAHIDTAWQWPYKTSIENYIYNTWTDQIGLLNANAGYHFSASSAQHYKWMKEYYPTLFAGIQSKVASGQWDIVGGQWVETDQNVPAGESIVREFLLGQNFFQAEFGKKAEVAFLPDSPGDSWIMPQIAAQSGIKAFTKTRINAFGDNPFATNGTYGADNFKWQGVDGTVLQSYKPTPFYVNSLSAGDINASLDSSNTLGIKKGMFYGGNGDQGGGPTQAMINGVNAVDSAATGPHAVFHNMIDYFNSLTATEKSAVPTWNKELYYNHEQGLYTSHAEMKKYNSANEINALNTEKLSSVAMWLGGASYPSAKLNAAWERILRAHQHDVVTGASTMSVYTGNGGAWNDQEVVGNLLDNSRSHAMAVIASRADTSGTGVPIVVFNPLSYSRTDVVETQVTFASPPSAVKVYDPSGTEIPSQTTSITGNTANILFIASNVPSIGYAVYTAQAAASPGTYSTGLSIGGNAIESNGYRVELNAATGNVKRIYDKANSREVLQSGKEVTLQKMTDQSPDGWYAYIIDYPQMAGATIVNDNNGGISYTGSWSASTGRGFGDFSDDVHYSTTNGDSVSYTFTGTRADMIFEKNSDEGDIDFYLDGVLQSSPSAANVTRVAKYPMFSVNNLANTTHTIKAVKKSGTYIVFDAVLTYGTAQPAINAGPTITQIEAGPIRSTYRVVKTDGSSTYTQNISLYASLDRIEFPMTVDFHETYKMIKAMFPLNVSDSKATYDLSYGTVARGNETPLQGEVPGQKWADITNTAGDYGVSVLSENKYGWDMPNNGTLRLSLLRSGTALDGGVTDSGTQTFKFAIAPHAGGWASANTPQKATAMANPLIAYPTTAHSGALGKSFSFVSVDQPNIMVTAIKKVEDSGSDDLIFRLYESQGAASTSATVTFAGTINSLAETNLLEAGVGTPSYSGNSFTTSFGNYQIKSFRATINSPNYSNTKPTVTAMNLSSAYNIDGMSYDSARSDGNLDGHNFTLSADLLPSTITSEDVAFTLGPKTNGASNVVVGTGQTVTLTGGSYRNVYLLGAGTNGTQTGAFTIRYTDGTTATQSVTMQDWCAVIGGFGLPRATDTIGFVNSHRHSASADEVNLENYMYVYKLPANPGKTVSGITFPNNTNMKVYAISATV